jgi:hypothetical protein
MLSLSLRRVPKANPFMLEPGMGAHHRPRVDSDLHLSMDGYRQVAPL